MPTTFDFTRVSLLVEAGHPDNRKAQVAFAECYAGLIQQRCRLWGLQQADADDVTQSVLSRLFQVLPTFKYDPNRRFRGLVCRMVQHAIVDLHRARQRSPGGCGSGDTGVLCQLHEAPGQLHEAPDPDDASIEELARELAEQMERDQRLDAACQRVEERVEPRTWQAFRLTTVEGLPAAKVAQQLGMKKGAVLVYKHRVVKMIRSEIERAAGKREPGAACSGSP